MDHWGYTWEAFEVHTEDHYILTTFHVTGTKDGGRFTPTRESIFVQHSLAKDAASWLMSYRFPLDLKYKAGKPMALQLADLGYDIFMGNNRGTPYSQGHETLDATKDKAYWAHTW